MKTIIITMTLLFAYGCSNKEVQPEAQTTENTVVIEIIEETKDSSETEVIDEAPAEEVAPVVEEIVPVIEETEPEVIPAEEVPVEETPEEVEPDEEPQEEGDNNG